MPILDRFFLKNPIRLWCSKMGLINTTSPVVVFARKRMADRGDSIKAETKTENGPPRRDFLSRFLEGHKKDPDFMTQERVLALTVANMFAGSDTTAITLRAIFYYLLRNPSKLQKLMEELDRTEQAGLLSREDSLVKWNEVRELPYLSAVIKEALRCHPAVGLTLERVVPPAGIKVCGQFLPGGTIVGCSAWTVHRSEAIFGANPIFFRPERWIEATEEKKAEMSNFLFSFGAGARTCIGKNISLLEMYKLVPAVLRRFEVCNLFLTLKYILSFAVTPVFISALLTPFSVHSSP
jgi:cytochrome P450